MNAHEVHMRIAALKFEEMQLHPDEGCDLISDAKKEIVRKKALKLFEEMNNDELQLAYPHVMFSCSSLLLEAFAFVMMHRLANARGAKCEYEMKPLEDWWSVSNEARKLKRAKTGCPIFEGWLKG